MLKQIKTWFQSVLGTGGIAGWFFGYFTVKYSKWTKYDQIRVGYERNPVVASIVDRIAQLTADVPVYIKYRATTGGGEGQTYDHPVLHALDRFAGGRKQLISLIATNYLVTGEVYIVKLRDPVDPKRIIAFEVLPSDMTDPVVEKNGPMISHYECRTPTGVKRFKRQDIIYICKRSLSDPVHGFSFVAALQKRSASSRKHTEHCSDCTRRRLRNWLRRRKSCSNFTTTARDHA